MSKELYINGKVAVCTNEEEIEVIKKYFDVEIKDKLVETHDISESDKIYGRKVFKNINDIKNFVLYLQNNNLDYLIGMNSNKANLVGVLKNYAQCIDLEKDIIPGIIFIRPEFDTNYKAVNVDTFLGMVDYEISQYEWVLDIDWKKHYNRSDQEKIVSDFKKMIEDNGIKYRCLTKRPILTVSYKRKK